MKPTLAISICSFVDSATPVMAALRRCWLKWSFAAIAWTSFSATAATGIAVPGLESLDSAMTQVCRTMPHRAPRWAVMKDGRLVYARGFGVADRDTGRLVQPTTPFR